MTSLNDRKLMIAASGKHFTGVWLGEPDFSGWHFAPEDLPELVAALYQAAGQEAPIILPRPSTEDLRAHGWIDGNRVNADAGRVAGTTTPGVARELAACLAAAADVAQVEPDPEQLKQLVALLDPWATVEANARAVLAAGYTRSES
ncbi:hypothetical protein [Nonomuraea sp. NPDC023979]|uniref:hypothetical protein n=1 Tax=Nonomuraea sp. NPDC023979 TaxID=3154796 RepID=UPI003403BAF3